MQYFKRGKNAIHVVWEINDINGNPRDLSHLIPTVFYSCGSGKVQATPIEVNENRISWVFPAKDQKLLGTYALSLVLNTDNGIEYSRLYRAEAFTLTPQTANDSIMAVQVENEQNVFLTACMTLADMGSKTDYEQVRVMIDQSETDIKDYIGYRFDNHCLVFNGNNTKEEILNAIEHNVPIISHFGAGRVIGGMTIDSTQTAAATTVGDDGDLLELRFVLKNDNQEYFQVCYSLYPDAEEWIEDADVLATKDDLANKAEVFILTYDSSLEEVQNAYNKGYLIATYWQHVDKGTTVILFASSVMLNNDLGLEDFRPNILFNLIEDNGYVTEIYFNWSYDVQEWIEDHYQYKIPKRNEVVTLSGEQTITGTKTFSAGVNMNNSRIRKLATPVNNDDVANKSYVDGTVSKIPVEKGTGDYSVIQKQPNSVAGVSVPVNNSHSISSVCEGAGNVAGLKGYRWASIGFDSNTINFNTTPTGWSVGDVLSIINDSKYQDCCKITSINGSTVKVDTLPFSSVAIDSGYDAKCAYVSAKPTAGDIDLGVGAHAEGVKTEALNLFAHAEGFGTKALGQYSHAEGRETVAHYASHAEGKRTKASGENSHSEGEATVSSGNWSHAEGFRTIAIGRASHIEGERGNQKIPVGDSAMVSLLEQQDSGKAIGNHSHVEGVDCTAVGSSSHVGGYRSVTYGGNSFAHGQDVVTRNGSEVAFGRNNRSHQYDASKFGDPKNTLFSVGMSGNYNTKKNAIEIMQNGDAYLNGIGGYDEENIDSSKTVQEVITSLETKIADPEWGGVLCLTLGDDKPKNLGEIYNKLRNLLDNKKHYLVSVYDSVFNVFMGDAEVTGGDNSGNIYLTSLRKIDVDKKIIGRIVYTFNKSSTAEYYKREYAELVTIGVDDYNSLINRITKLESIISQITIKE